MIQQPIFELQLPSTGKKIRYRQFTVLEEKILMVAQASTDADGNPEQKAIVQAFKQLITNCALDKVDVDAMTTYDIEWFFIQLRAKSVGNVIDLEFDEPTTILDEFMVDEATGTKKKPPQKIKVAINLDDVRCSKPTLNNRIVLSAEQGIGVVMRYPTFDMISSLGDDDDSFSLIEKCIVSIFDSSRVYPTVDAEPGDLRRWFDDLNTQQREQMNAFLSDMPYVYLDFSYTDGAGVLHEQQLRGISDFFV